MTRATTALSDQSKNKLGKACGDESRGGRWMRWRGVEDGCGEQEGRGEMGVADSAGDLKEGMVGADGEHIQQPKLGNAMIEVKDSTGVPPNRYWKKKQHDIPYLPVHVSFKERGGKDPKFWRQSPSEHRAYPPIELVHPSAYPSWHSDRGGPKT
jgi:hypothetical protein